MKCWIYTPNEYTTKLSFDITMSDESEVVVSATKGEGGNWISSDPKFCKPLSELPELVEKYNTTNGVVIFCEGTDPEFANTNESCILKIEVSAFNKDGEEFKIRSAEVNYKYRFIFPDKKYLIDHFVKPELDSNATDEEIENAYKQLLKDVYYFQSTKIRNFFERDENADKFVVNTSTTTIPNYVSADLKPMVVYNTVKQMRFPDLTYVVNNQPENSSCWWMLLDPSKDLKYKYDHKYKTYFISPIWVAYYIGSQEGIAQYHLHNLYDATRNGAYDIAHALQYVETNYGDVYKDYIALPIFGTPDDASHYIDEDTYLAVRKWSQSNN